MARRGGAKGPAAPLAQREGVDPVRLRLPRDDEGRWATVRAYLVERYGAAVGAGRVDAMLAAGRFVTEDGPLDPAAGYRAGTWVWFHRDLAPEPEVPFPVRVVHRDERIVVADKPHFLATTPRGRHITQTALARLRGELALPALSPAHRLDRLTAGLVLFVVRPQDRGAYQTLFRDRLVRKEYEAVAAYRPEVALPRTVHSRIVKEHGQQAAREEPGPPNAETRIELLARRDGLGRYRLLPLTGRTHQLRVHMNALGLPLLNDPLYPEVLPDAGARPAADAARRGPAAWGEWRAQPGEAADDLGARGGAEPDVAAGIAPADGPAAEAATDFSRPLQLLARALEFTDPLTGRAMRFESTRELAAWPRQG